MSMTGSLATNLSAGRSAADDDPGAISAEIIGFVESEPSVELALLLLHCQYSERIPSSRLSRVGRKCQKTPEVRTCIDRS